jgi:hypothetical protein
MTRDSPEHPGYGKLYEYTWYHLWAVRVATNEPRGVMSENSMAEEVAFTIRGIPPSSDRLEWCIELSFRRLLRKGHQ